MLNRYQILNDGKGEKLFIYLDDRFETATEFNTISQDETLVKQVEHYLSRNQIKLKGNQIYIVKDGIIVGTLFYNPLEQRVYSKYNAVISAPEIEVLEVDEALQEKIEAAMTKELKVKLRLISGTIITISLDDYLLGTLSQVISPTYELEALKAQAILSRTYALKMMIQNGVIEQSNPTQTYHHIHYAKLTWLDHYDSYLYKLKQAIDSTREKYLAYNDKMIDVFFHPVNNGHTESAKSLELGDVPYLKQKPSIWDMQAPSYLQTTAKNKDEVALLLGVSKKDLKKIEILELTEGNQIKRIRIGNKEFTGDQLKRLLHLPSQDISILIDKNAIFFTTRGQGNGLGMSQFGANIMAQNGHTCEEILAYFFPNTRIWSFESSR